MPKTPPSAETILYNYDVLVQLDAIFARAQLSYAMDAGRPMVRKRGGIDLKRARHPLLDQAKAVPVTVELGGRFDTLVIVQQVDEHAAQMLFVEQDVASRFSYRAEYNPFLSQFLLECCLD